MPHPNPALDRTGHIQTYVQRIAANLNWAKRMTMGFISNAHVHRNHSWIKAHPEYKTSLTQERRDQLDKIQRLIEQATFSNSLIIEAIEEYYQLPAMPKSKSKQGG